MKSILLVCARSNIDTPLRRSLAHLVNSCQVEIVADGYAAFKELSERAFNLVIIDFEIGEIDGLELAESVSHIDPDVPVILMFNQPHKAMWGQARALNASPILRPFKPLTFLRLVDTLLHYHLERFRDLSEALQTVLESLAELPGVTSAFLAAADGRTLLAANPPEPEYLAALGQLAAAPPSPDAPGQPLLALNPAEQDHELLVLPVLDNLLLAVLAPLGQAAPVELEPKLAQASQAMRLAVSQHSAAHVDDEPDAPAGQLTVIPIRFNREPAASPPPIEAGLDDVAVNWAILSGNADTLTRLRDILSR